jgi:cytochrome c oxidase cbb3-type subunit 3
MDEFPGSQVQGCNSFAIISLSHMNRQFVFAALATLIATAGPSSGQSASADSQGRPIKFDQAVVERGKSLFIASCGFCHGSNAKGGEKGPDLLRSVIVLDDDNGKTIGPVILKGRPDKGMPRFPFTQSQISDISIFLHSAIRDATDRDNYKILDIVTGDANAGRAYFESHCGKCHSETGDLKGIAKKYDPVTLQGKFINPPFSWEEGTPPHTVSAISVTVTLPSGESYTGTAVNYDDFNVSLRERDGTYRSFKRNGDTPRVELHNRLQAHLELVLKYSDADIHNLTAYLVTLK